MRRCSAIMLLVCAALFLTTGCATVRTMPSLGSYGTPHVYSGTRLDLDAIHDDQAGLSRFTAKPPEHLGLDLPFSMLVDTLILPVVLPVVLYEAVFGGT
jgi:uncharacterized protein YceK